MRKIRLQLDMLAVESFGTTHPVRAEGTVDGHQLTVGCQPITAAGCQTAGPTCYRTCASCAGTACVEFTCTCFCTLEPTFCVACDTRLDCGPR